MKPTELRFGTAGIPIGAACAGTAAGIRFVNQLGLGAMELEFVRSVNISEEKAPAVKKAAEDNDVLLTCHGQYFINLNSNENKKIEESKARILKAARIANLCGAWSLCFHAGFYMGGDPSAVYEKIKAGLKEITEILRNEGNSIWVRPETTGKGTQFGTVQEILKLSAELDNVMPCVDFSHLHARANGKENTYEEFCKTLWEIEKALGRKGLDNMHMHLSGIAYGEKGEKNHLVLKESDMNYEDLLKALGAFKAKGAIICESPNIEQDALLLKQVYE